MGRSLSNAKILTYSFFDGFSLHLFHFRRGFAAEVISRRNYGKVRSTSDTVRKVEDMAAVTKEDKGASSSWTPDLVTGYYRLANRAGDINQAELREMLLNHRVRPK